MVTTKDDTQDIIKLAQEKIMKEDCKHEPLCFVYATGQGQVHAQFPANIVAKCSKCNAELVATWTVKQEPIKFEVKIKIPETDTGSPGIYNKYYMVRFPFVDTPPEAAGKRFHVVATEIVE